MKTILVLIILLLTELSPAQTSWVRSFTGKDTTRYCTKLITKGSNVYAATDSGIYRSTNFGSNWSVVGLKNTSVLDITLKDSNIYALATSNYFDSLYKSLNDSTWVRIPMPPNQGSSLNKIFIDSNYIYIACDANSSFRGLYISSNEGVSWSHVTQNYSTSGFARDNSYLFQASSDSGVYRSTNRGLTWEHTPLNFRTSCIQSYHDTIYVGANNNPSTGPYNGLWRSLDHGNNWKKIHQVWNGSNGYLGDESIVRYGKNLIVGSNLFVCVSIDDSIWTFKSGVGQGIDPHAQSLVILNNYIFAGGSNGNPVSRRLLANVILTDIRSIKEIPSDLKLEQNFPNPFNPSTKISFSIPKSELVTLKVYDILGKEVSTLLNEVHSPGMYSLDFNSKDLTSGIYLYRLQAGNYIKTRRMLLIK